VRIRIDARAVTAVISITLTLAFGSVARADGWVHGEFQSGGKPVEENHCVPSGAGPFPVVVMLHWAGARDDAGNEFENICSKLADSGYYTEFIEYYSQTEVLITGDSAGMVANLPTWLSEVHSGIAALKKNPSIASNKVALMGFSLGAYIALAYGATFPDDLAAIVEYYGGLIPDLYPHAATMPPVLILQGSSDRIVPRSQATDLDEALTKAGRPHQMKIYVGVQHGFNIPNTASVYNQSAADDAWDRSLKFLDTYLKM
jgi:carboxymethylenebutenolidase